MNTLVCTLLIGAVALCAMAEAGRPMAGATGMMFFQSSGGQGQMWRFGGTPTAAAMRRSSAPDCATKSGTRTADNNFEEDLITKSNPVSS